MPKGRVSMNIIFCLYYVITVPAPDVAVTVTYATPLYVGSSLTLTCTVTLDPNVDNNETVSTSWSGPNHISGKRYLIDNASNSDRTYTSSLTINPIVQQDNGTYICTGIVKGENEEQVTASANYTLSINRKTLFSYLQALYIGFFVFI